MIAELSEVEKRRREKNSLAQRKHREKTREKARRQAFRLQELEQAIEEIRHAVENDSLHQVGLILSKVAKAPSNNLLRTDVQYQEPSVFQPYSRTAFNPPSSCFNTNDHSRIGHLSLIDSLLPTYVPGSLDTPWTEDQQNVRVSGQQSHLGLTWSHAGAEQWYWPYPEPPSYSAVTDLVFKGSLLE